MTNSAARGRLQIYTGDGKGKTTAAIGLAIRAAGAGERCAFLQFDKGFDSKRGEHYSERRILRSIPNIEFCAFGCERMRADGTFRFDHSPEDFAQAAKALERSREILRANSFFLVVLDEILAAIQTRLVKLDDVLGIVDLWREVSPDTELVLTGRGAPPEIIARAGLVTEMRLVRHYFEQGAPAKKGIEF